MVFAHLLQAAPPPPSAAPPSAAPPPPSTTTGSTTTHAPGGPAGPFGALCGGGPSSMPLMMMMMFVVVYLFMIRPQQKKQREQEAWLKALKKGDEVVTSGGLIGRVSLLADTTVVLELQDKVRVKVLRSAISGKAPAAPTPTVTPVAPTSETEKK